MKTNHSYFGNPLLSVATALAIVLAGAPGTAFAQAKSTSPQKVATAAGPAAAVGPTKASSQGGGSQEGIKVHGQWTIEVRNPDGTVAERREFRNAYVGTPGILPVLLGRQSSPGPWVILLEDATAANPQPCTSTCLLLEGTPGTGSFFGAPIASTNVSVSVVGSTGSSNSQLLLSGSFTATAAADITRATTIINTCPATAAPASCAHGSNPVPFSQTGTGAFQPVSVVPGRIVQVTVTFTFS